MDGWIKLMATGVRGNRSVLLSSGMVYGDERPCLSSNVHPTLLRLHHILLLLLYRRDCSSWQVIAPPHTQHKQIYWCFNEFSFQYIPIVLFPSMAALWVALFWLQGFTAYCGVRAGKPCNLRRERKSRRMEGKHHPWSNKRDY